MSLLVFGLALAALAGVPDGIRPVAAPVDVPAQYAAFLEKSGKKGDPLACRELWPGQALLCFRVWEKKKRRWVTEADLASWAVTVDDLAAATRTHAKDLIEGGLETVAVEGTTDSYVRFSDGDGWAASVALAPDVIAAKLGLPFLAAIPAEGVFVAWSPGKPELDYIMAVGVRELHDQQDGSVSPKVHAWDGQRWTPFGEAKSR